jgi:hypothetical protein
MRLSQNQINAIVSSFKELFSDSDHLWLFGSRVDDTQFGGDIDLYIETTEMNSTLAYDKKFRLSALIQMKIGEQKIDIVINMLSSNKDKPIYVEARNTGILLV